MGTSGIKKDGEKNLFNIGLQYDNKFVDVPSTVKLEDTHFEKYEFVTVTFKIKLKDKKVHHEIEDNIIISNELRAIIDANFKSLQVHEINEINYKEKYYELVNNIKKTLED